MAVFGDSYSDTGNVYKLTHGAWPLRHPYFHGRFTNGPTWSEHVAAFTGFKLANYAYGGGTSDATLVQGYTGKASDVRVPGFIQQLDAYERIANHRDADSTLFVVDFQGNDFFFNSTLPPALVVDRIHEGIDRLVRLGARRILLFQNINTGLLPYFSAQPEVSKAFTDISSAEQDSFKTLIRTLNAKYGHVVRFKYLNLWTLFEDLYHPDQLRRLGITDVTHGCVSNDYSTICEDVDKHFYIDGFHPTRKVHKEIADAALRVLRDK